MQLFELFCVYLQVGSEGNFGFDQLVNVLGSHRAVVLVRFSFSLSQTISL